MIKKHQRDALQNVVDSEDLLKAAWDNPRRYNFDKRRVALVVLMVATSNGKFVWEVSVRLQSRKAAFLTPPTIWTTVEREKVVQILMNETLGIGDPFDQEIWSSKNSLHITKALMPYEIDIVEGRNWDVASGPAEGREVASEAGDQGNPEEAG